MALFYAHRPRPRCALSEPVDGDPDGRHPAPRRHPRPRARRRGTTDPVEIGSFDVPLSLPAPCALLGDAPVRIAVDMDGYRTNLAAVLRAAADTVETVEPANDPT
jgi:hypothetical protein